MDGRVRDVQITLKVGPSTPEISQTGHVYQQNVHLTMNFCKEGAPIEYNRQYSVVMIFPKMLFVS